MTQRDTTRVPSMGDAKLGADAAFDQQVHEAYERIELSAEAQERMLANLLAARDAREAGGARKDAPQAEEPVAAQDAEPAGEVTAFVPRRWRWLVALPVAAALLVAAIVLELNSRGADTHAAMMVKETTASEEYAEASGAAAVEDAVSEDAAPDAEAAQNGALAETEELAQDTGSQVLGLVDLYPSITMEDGTWLTALEDGLYTREVPSEEVGPLLGTAKAGTFDGDGIDDDVACEVFGLAHDPEAYAVRYEGEKTYWRCTKLS